MFDIRTMIPLLLLCIVGLFPGCKNRQADSAIPRIKSTIKSAKTIYQYGEPIDITYEITNDSVFTVTVAQRAVRAKLLNGSLCKFTAGRTDQGRENAEGKNPEESIPPAKIVAGRGEAGTFRLTPGKWRVWISWQYDLKSKYAVFKQFPYTQDSSSIELEVRPLDSAGYPLLADAINDDKIPLQDRFELISAIPDLPQAAFFVPKLIEALNDPKAKIWITAARVLGFLGDARAVQPLIKGLDEHKHACFIMALGDMKAAAAVPYLIGLLQKIGRNEIQLDSKVAKINILKSTDQALGRITGQPSPCNLDTNPEKGDELIQKWSEWWEKNKKLINTGLPHNISTH